MQGLYSVFHSVPYRRGEHIYISMPVHCDALDMVISYLIGIELVGYSSCPQGSTLEPDADVRRRIAPSRFLLSICFEGSRNFPTNIPYYDHPKRNNMRKRQSL